MSLVSGREGEVWVSARFSRARLTKQGRESVPIWEMREIVSEEKRSWREVRLELGFTRRYLSAVTRSERRMCLPSRTKPGWRVGEEKGEVEGMEDKEEVREMGFQLWVRLERSMAVIVSWCAVDLRLEVWR